MSHITRIPIPGAPDPQHLTMGGAGSGIVMMTQIPSGAGGKIVGENVQEQTRQIFENYRTGLAPVGASVDDILHVTVYLTDIDRMGEFAAVWNEVYPEVGPNRVSVEVSRLVSPEILVETTAVVALPPSA